MLRPPWPRRPRYLAAAKKVPPRYQPWLVDQIGTRSPPQFGLYRAGYRMTYVVFVAVLAVLWDAVILGAALVLVAVIITVVRAASPSYSERSRAALARYDGLPMAPYGPVRHSGELR